MAQLKRIALFARDLQRSTAFWGENGLGLRTLVESHEDVLLESNGVGIHIRQTYDEALLSTGYSPMLQFDVKDVAGTVPRLLATGATMDGGIVHGEQATVASLRSPCGIMVALVEAHDLVDPGGVLVKPVAQPPMQ